MFSISNLFRRNRGIPSIRKGALTDLEKVLFDHLISSLSPTYSNTIRRQLQFLTHHRRLEYKYQVVTELHQSAEAPIQSDDLFGRGQEFRLAIIKFRIKDTRYKAEVHAVLGAIFDMSINPKPEETDITELEIVSIKFAEELDRDLKDPPIYEQEIACSFVLDFVKSTDLEYEVHESPMRNFLQSRITFF